MLFSNLENCQKANTDFLLSRAIVKEILRCLCDVLRMRDGQLPENCPFGQSLYFLGQGKVKKKMKYDRLPKIVPLEIFSLCSAIGKKYLWLVDDF